MSLVSTGWRNDPPAPRACDGSLQPLPGRTRRPRQRPASSLPRWQPRSRTPRRTGVASLGDLSRCSSTEKATPHHPGSDHQESAQDHQRSGLLPVKASPVPPERDTAALAPPDPPPLPPLLPWTTRRPRWTRPGGRRSPLPRQLLLRRWRY